jgi:hypothetical protein
VATRDKPGAGLLNIHIQAFLSRIGEIAGAIASSVQIEDKRPDTVIGERLRR